MNENRESLLIGIVLITLVLLTPSSDFFGFLFLLVIAFLIIYYRQERKKPIEQRQPVQPMQPITVRCMNCRTLNPESSKFCSECGSLL
jgi:hypothetical protein